MSKDWQDIANELSDGIRALHTALEDYNKALDKAYDFKKCLDDKAEFDGEWHNAEGAVMAIEGSIMDLAQLTNYIEEYLA
jgi:hypothetical protein